MKTKHICFTRNAAHILIPACLALAPLATLAASIDGGSAGVDSITGTAYDPLVSVDAFFGSDSTRYCAVTCSAEAQNPALPLIPATYRLAVTSNGVVVGGSERLWEFEENIGVVNDVSITEVSTTAAFKILANNTPQISCSARKNNTFDPNMTIHDSSMSMVCDDEEIDNAPALPTVND